MRAIVSLVAALAFQGGASAGELTLSVRAAGRPQSDVVVMAYPAARPASPPRLSGPFRMVQRDMQFDPFVLVVPVGAEVAFPNFDTVRHHVYSFSPAHPFELKLYGHDQTRSVRFDKAGVIALGCNIHDQMVAFIRVVDTPYSAKSDASGRIVLRDLPNGATVLRIWHPYLRASQNEISRNLIVEGDKAITIDLDMRPPPDRMAY